MLFFVGEILVIKMGCAVAPLEKLEKVEFAHIILNVKFVTGSAESKDSPKNW